ncbi:serine/threonine-protein kinase, partial [Nocardia sp. NPDC056100]|uniref:serine/threonine-protein kinase n=1 Tax=Nocardia sp. NPDC056100 TaxID=3345712 RepID=UPI0035E24AA7
MGVVYLARHPRLKRDVALKVLHDQWALDQGARAAFDREAALVSQLDHPNIVQVHDCSDPEDEALWLSMRHIAGGDAAALLAGTSGGLPIEQVIRLVTDTAHALDHAHAKGVLHRDVKPANLLLEQDPRHGQKAVLTDFGIARTADSATTVTGIAMSLPYTAPERFAAGSVDHRADIYSLGCTMFQLLTGQLPFPRQAPVEFMTAHLTAPVPSAHAIRLDLPVHLDSVIATALAKDAADRYPSGQALVADLLRAVTVTTLTPRSAAQFSAAPVDTSRLMLNLGVLLQDRGDLAEAESWFRKAIDAGNTIAMDELGFLLKQRGDLAEAESWFRKAIDAGNIIAMDDLGFLLKQRGDLAEAEVWFRKAIDAGNTNAMSSLGVLLQDRGDLAEAESWFRKAIDAGNTIAMDDLGFLLKQRGDLAEAEVWFRKAIDAGNANAMNNLGVMLKQRGDL